MKKTEHQKEVLYKLNQALNELDDLLYFAEHAWELNRENNQLYMELTMLKNAKQKTKEGRDFMWRLIQTS